MTSPDPPGIGTSDRRRSKRQAQEGTVRVHIDTPDLEGPASNVSRSGVLFFTDGDLRVTVEIQHDGEVITRAGHLVRCERIKGEHRGWAVEFDQE
jgi:hypothetical protein